MVQASIPASAWGGRAELREPIEYGNTSVAEVEGNIAHQHFLAIEKSLCMRLFSC
jgi:hypothetical protein